MFSDAVGIPLNWDYYCVMQQPIQQSSRHHWVPKDVCPLPESPVARHDHGAAFVTGVNQLQLQIQLQVAPGAVGDAIAPVRLRSRSPEYAHINSDTVFQSYA